MYIRARQPARHAPTACLTAAGVHRVLTDVGRQSARLDDQRNVAFGVLESRKSLDVGGRERIGRAVKHAILVGEGLASADVL